MSKCAILIFLKLSLLRFPIILDWWSFQLTSSLQYFLIYCIKFFSIFRTYEFLINISEIRFNQALKRSWHETDTGVNDGWIFKNSTIVQVFVWHFKIQALHCMFEACDVSKTGDIITVWTILCVKKSYRAPNKSFVCQNNGLSSVRLLLIPNNGNLKREEIIVSGTKFNCPRYVTTDLQCLATVIQYSTGYFGRNLFTIKITLVITNYLQHGSI